MAKTNRRRPEEPEIFEVEVGEEPVKVEVEVGEETGLTALETSQEAEENRPELAGPDLDNPEASKAWRLGPSPAEVKELLNRGKFGILKLVPWGSNYTFLAVLEDEETGGEFAVIYKPQMGEAPLWDFPNGTLYQREYAAFLVSEALGWNFIPPVVVRDGPHGIGTVQLFVQVYDNVQYYQFREKHRRELMRIAIFDLITNNADRKAGHCLLGEDGFIWGIDHGLCFNLLPKLRTIIWDYTGQRVPRDILDDLEEFYTDAKRAGALRAELEKILEPEETGGFFRRLEQVLKKPVFPGLTSRRQVPWSMW